jgi:hypothetical protein
MKLFLDDVRDPAHCVGYMHKRIGSKNVIYTEQDWAIVRSYQEFIDWLQAYGAPKFVSFDHDLAHEHYTELMLNNENYDACKFTEKTGLHCAEALVAFCEHHGVPVPDYAVHSMNPVGAERIEWVMKAAR